VKGTIQNRLGVGSLDREVNIKHLEMNHIKIILQALGESDLNRSEDYFNLSLLENELNKRITLIAFCQKEFAGYINILFNSKYPYFYKNRIPEISDFFVMPKYRKNGIGTTLLKAAESVISNDYNCVGLGVGLYVDYGPVEDLYISNGYVPDVNSNTANARLVSGNYIRLDDELMVYLFKRLK
jgi:GNAT superfamily N-acetyltransferase